MATTSTEKPGTSVKQSIFQTIMDLHNTNRIASRQVISDLTGLKMSIVDDHIRNLKDDGKVRSVVNGIIEPVLDAAEDRAVSVTFLPKGGAKLEIGDVVIELTLREARLAGMALGGVPLTFAR